MPAQVFIPIAPPPGVVTDRGAEAFGASLAPLMKKDVATPAGPRQLALGVYIPADMGARGAVVRMWSNGRANTALVETVREELTQALRVQALVASGIDMPALTRIQGINAPVSLTIPPSGSGRERLMLRSALPLALAYLLLMSLMMSGSWMLQGLIEERSNKLLEAVLACVTPDQLLYGKLMGVVAVGHGHDRGLDRLCHNRRFFPAGRGGRLRAPSSQLYQLALDRGGARLLFPRGLPVRLNDVPGRWRSQRQSARRAGLSDAYDPGADHPLRGDRQFCFARS